MADQTVTSKNCKGCGKNTVYLFILDEVDLPKRSLAGVHCLQCIKNVRTSSFTAAQRVFGKK